jgi:cyclopropane fatty-acyl-phospholipid synthase-like methyltransferase
MDASNGYERVAAELISARSPIGGEQVSRWAKRVKPSGTVLDLGCGAGVPVTQALIDAGLTVFGIDASPSLVHELKRRFPMVSLACESVLDSTYFDQRFDGVVAWGLMFLLTSDEQQVVINKIATALEAGGRFLFTAPAHAATWRDVLTDLESQSLGAQRYRELLSAVGLEIVDQYEDEGQNHYFDTVKE